MAYKGGGIGRRRKKGKNDVSLGDER